MAFSNILTASLQRNFYTLLRMYGAAYLLFCYMFTFLLVAFALTYLVNPLLAIALVDPIFTVPLIIGGILFLGAVVLSLAESLLSAILWPNVTYVPVNRHYRSEIQTSQPALRHFEHMPVALHVPDVKYENLSKRFESTLQILERLKPSPAGTVIDDFKCGISLDIMSEPIAAKDSLNAIHFYDRNQLRLYYQTEMSKGKRIAEITDPISRQPIVQLTRDEGLRLQIVDYLQTLEKDFNAYLPVPSV